MAAPFKIKSKTTEKMYRIEDWVHAGKGVYLCARICETRCGKVAARWFRQLREQRKGLRLVRITTTKEELIVR